MSSGKEAGKPALVLVRHAHTTPAGPDAKAWPLSARGEMEAARLARWDGWRGVTRIVASAEAKAQRTAAAITVAHPHITTLPPVAALGEVERPATWVADYEAAVAAFLAAPEQSPEGWETAAHARARFVTAVDACLAAHPGESMAVVAHGLVLTLYLSSLMDGPSANLVTWRAIPFAAVALVERGTRRLLCPFFAPI